MYARVVTLAGGDPTRVDEIVAAVRDRFASGAPEGLDEMRSFWMLVDRERAQILGVSLFDDRAALQRGSKVLDGLPHPAPDAGGRPVSVDVYEIPVHYERADRRPDSGGRRRSRLRDPHERLPDRLAAHHARERVGSVLEAVDHGLAPVQPSVAQQRADLALHLVEEVDVARAAEAADLEVLRDEEEEVARPGRRLGGVVLGDRAADRDPPAPPQGADRRLEVVAADVVEVDVDPVRRGLPQQLRRRGPAW